LLDWPFGGAKAKRGKQAFEHPIVDKSLEKHEEEGPRVGSSSKEFLSLMDAFFVFVVQKGETITQNQETTKLMNDIVENLDAISNAPSGGSTKATIKARSLDVGKETKTKWVRPWLHQVEA